MKGEIVIGFDIPYYPINQTFIGVSNVGVHPTPIPYSKIYDDLERFPSVIYKKDNQLVVHNVVNNKRLYFNINVLFTLEHNILSANPLLHNFNMEGIIIKDYGWLSFRAGATGYFFNIWSGLMFLEMSDCTLLANSLSSQNMIIYILTILQKNIILVDLSVLWREVVILAKIITVMEF